MSQLEDLGGTHYWRELLLQCAIFCNCIWYEPSLSQFPKFLELEIYVFSVQLAIQTDLLNSTLKVVETVKMYWINGLFPYVLSIGCAPGWEVNVDYTSTTVRNDRSRVWQSMLTFNKFLKIFYKNFCILVLETCLLPAFLDWLDLKSIWNEWLGGIPEGILGNFSHLMRHW